MRPARDRHKRITQQKTIRDMIDIYGEILGAESCGSPVLINVSF